MRTQDDMDVAIVKTIYLFRAAKALESALEGAARRQGGRVQRRLDLAERDLQHARRRATDALVRRQGGKWRRTALAVTKALNWTARAARQLREES